MRKLILVIAMLGTGPALADGHQPSLGALISDTLGYANLSDGVVILEGEEMGTFICKIDVSDAAFANYAASGNTGGAPIGYSCIPVEEFEK
jgi:hypothetical protein